MQDHGTYHGFAFEGIDNVRFEAIVSWDPDSGVQSSLN
jgi:hypothetical protein